MALSKDSAEQSPLPTVLFLPPAASVPDFHLNLPIRAHETLDSVQTITPPQETLQHAVFPNQADKVRADLKDYLTGQYLGFLDKPREYILPVWSLYQLLEDPDFESDKNQLRLKISYDARTSILTLFKMPGSRHARTIDWLSDLAKDKLNPSLRKRLITIRGEDWEGFCGEWKASRKEPDLGIAWIKDDGGTKLHTVVEVGVSQSRQSILNLRDLYLKGTSEVSRFVLVNIITDPEYTSPKELDINELNNIQPADFHLVSNQGPLWYKGVQWVGESTLTWEVWERNLNGDPKQICFKEIDPNDSEIRFEFFEIPTTVATGIEAVTVTQTDIHQLWSHQWKHAIISEAESRMRRYVRDVEQRQKHDADLTGQKAEAARMRQKANNEPTER